MEIKKEIESNQITLLLIPNNKYSNEIGKILKEVKFKKIGYVCLNRSPAVLSSLLKGKIDEDKIAFVDCISQCRGEIKNCIPVSSPSDLFRISLSITKLLAEEKVDAIIFDSLSTLLAYNKEILVIQFAQSVIGKIRNSSCKGIFPCPKEDIAQTLVKDLEMFADNTITL
ncbi:MAG: hypothetical protein V1660_03605 [archaeon]